MSVSICVHFVNIVLPQVYTGTSIEMCIYVCGGDLGIYVYSFSYALCIGICVCFLSHMYVFKCAHALGYFYVYVHL